MRKAIADAVRRLTGLDDVRSVAVLTKWRQTAQDISETLRAEGIEGVSMLISDGLVEADVTVGSIILQRDWSLTRS